MLATMLAVWLAAGSARADAPVLDASAESVDVSPGLAILVDESATLTFEDVSGDETASRFTPWGHAHAPGFGLSTAAIWLRFDIENPTDTPLERWLELDQPCVDELRVFVPGQPEMVDGRVHPVGVSGHQRTTPAFRIEIPPHARLRVHARASGENELQLPLSLHSRSALELRGNRSLLLSATVLGVVLLMSLLNLVIGVSERARARLYYGAANLFGLAWLVLLGGTVNLVLHPGLVLPRAPFMAGALWNCLITLFVRDVLQTGRGQPRLDRVLAGHALLMGVLPLSPLVMPWRAVNQVSTLMLLLWVVLCAIASVRRARQGAAGAWLVLAGCLSMVVGGALGVLSVAGVLPLRPSFTFELAMLAQAVFMALALGAVSTARHRQLEASHVEVRALNDELRRQIAQRSRELVEILQTRPGVGLSPLREGDTVDGRYRVVKQLGAGAMGAVLEVERASDGKRFALKLVADQSVSSAQRLAREAEIAATISHRNLVSIVDVGVERAGTVFLVMELVRGGSLEERRPDFGRLPGAEALLRDIATGLGALHERGVIHRDLKPANVLIERGDAGEVAKIADFGISKVEETGAVDAAAATQAAGARLTATGVLVGTPLYMAPELARGGQAATPAVDVFAFGVLAYEVLTGRYPYDLPPVFAALGQGPIPAPPPPEGAPRHLGQLLAECLDADPRKRPTARALAQALG